jgi:oligogalacturonide lyase
VQQLDQPANKGQMMEQRLAAHLPMGLFTIDVKTGEVKTILKSTDWLNHLEFSPTDPTLLMLCHEGPWHKVDRLWTIRTDGSHITKVHTRTMAMEIFGHEFWNYDGKIMWYDLQTPRSEVFWLAGYNVETGQRTWYHLQRNEWSIHFNVSRDGKLFCGDGGNPGQVARAPDGAWIYLFRPELIRNQGVDDKSLIQAGVLRAEKLVNMSKHQYRLEPNVSFTPDQKWVVFRSNMFGETYVFAVEVAKAAAGQSK